MLQRYVGWNPLAPEEKSAAPLTGVAAIKETLHNCGLTGSLRGANPEDIANPAVNPFAIQNAILNNQYDKQPFGVTLRVAKKWFNETLEGELARRLLLNRSGYLVRPKLVYAYSDSIKLIGGVEYFGGSDKTAYGRQDKNRGVFAEVWYFF